jgi:hypothetical protein
MSRLVLDPTYIPLIQKPTCCAVTCLQMILFRNGYGLWDQEDLAVEFGVKIFPEMASAFRDSMPIVTQKNFDEGIQTIDSMDAVNKFFLGKKAALHAKGHRYSSIGSLSDFIATHIQANRDLWVEYHAQEIHKDDQYKGDYIHDGLVEAIDTIAQTVTVIDPVPEHRQRLTISLDVLGRAVSAHFGREAGFLVVEHVP